MMIMNLLWSSSSSITGLITNKPIKLNAIAMNNKKLTEENLRKGDWYVEISENGDKEQKIYDGGTLGANAYAMDFPWTDFKLMKAWGFKAQDSNMDVYVRKDCRIYLPIFNSGVCRLATIKEFPGTDERFEHQSFLFSYMHEFQQLMDIAGLTIKIENND